MFQPSDCYMNIDSIRTRYWQAGDAGSPVVLIHGLTGSMEGFLPILEPLAARHRVYALDLPGHGRTEKPGSFSYFIPDIARIVAHFMDQMGLRWAHVAGHSLGGAIALSLTLQFPERVDRLVLMDSLGLGPEVTYRLRVPVLPLAGELLARPQVSTREAMKSGVYDVSVLDEKAMQLDYEHACLPGAQQALLKLVRRNVSLFGVKGEVWEPIVRGLPSIDSPVLILWGRQDENLPVKHAEMAARKIRSARLHIFEHCKHCPMIEKTAEVNRLVGEFLRD